MQSDLAVTNKQYCQRCILLVHYIIQTYDARKLKHKIVTNIFVLWFVNFQISFMFQKLTGITEQPSFGEANIRLALALHGTTVCYSLPYNSTRYHPGVYLFAPKHNFLGEPSALSGHCSVSSTCFHTTQLVFSSNIVRISDMSNIKQKQIQLALSSQPCNFRNYYVLKYSYFLSTINSLCNVRKLHTQVTKP